MSRLTLLLILASVAVTSAFLYDELYRSPVLVDSENCVRLRCHWRGEAAHCGHRGAYKWVSEHLGHHVNSKRKIPEKSAIFRIHADSASKLPTRMTQIPNSSCAWRWAPQTLSFSWRDHSFSDDVPCQYIHDRQCQTGWGMWGGEAFVLQRGACWCVWAVRAQLRSTASLPSQETT